MKNFILILTISFLAILSCKKKGCTDHSATNYDYNAQVDDGSCVYSTPNNQSASYTDFMFSITIDGVAHKTEGSYGSNLGIYPTTATNHCYISNSTSGASLIAGIADKSSDSYVSGDIFALSLHFSNLSLGSSDASISISNGTNFTFPPDMIYSWGFSSTIDTIYSATPLFAFNITDLGSPTVYDYTNPYYYYDFGDPVIGSYSGTLYGTDGTFVSNSSTDTYGYVYNIPVQVSIEFKAARLW